MSTASAASRYAEVRAKFFPSVLRPIVRADPSLWQPKRPEPARKVMRRLGDVVPDVVSPTRIERIVKMACIMFGATKAEVLGDCRDALLVNARIYVAFRLRKEFGFSRARIGRVINRDQSTVFNLLAKAAGIPLHASGKRRKG